MPPKLYSLWGRAPRAYEVATSLYLLDPAAAGAIDALGLERGERVLDLCCGTGLNLPRLVAQVGGAGSVVALDASREMLARARARVRDLDASNVAFHEADAAATGLDDAGFDAVLCVLGLSVVPDPGRVVREARRVLRPGGRFVVFDGGAYRGPLRVVNPIVRPLVRYAAGADADRDFAALVRTEFARVHVRRSQAGSFTLAIARRQVGSGSS